jgi:hypothetical protein
MRDDVTRDAAQYRQANGWPLASAIEFGPLPTAVPCARLHAKLVLAEWDLGDLADDAELVISELMTNAVIASEATHEPVALCLRTDRRTLLVEVWDRLAEYEPQPQVTDETSEAGHGLTIVAALATRWGFTRVSYSTKIVWAEFARDATIYA